MTSPPSPITPMLLLPPNPKHLSFLISDGNNFPGKRVTKQKEPTPPHLQSCIHPCLAHQQTPPSVPRATFHPCVAQCDKGLPLARCNGLQAEKVIGRFPWQHCRVSCTPSDAHVWSVSAPMQTHKDRARVHVLVFVYPFLLPNCPPIISFITTLGKKIRTG